MQFNDGKSADAFRTIREVSEALDVPQHILRFWETRFPQLKPLQRGGNRRYYRPEDVALANALHILLHREGYTVKGVQKLMADHGPLGLTALADGQPLKVAVAAVEAASALLRPAPDSGLVWQLQQLRDRLAAAIAA